MPIHVTSTKHEREVIFMAFGLVILGYLKLVVKYALIVFTSSTKKETIEACKVVINR
jgi:hypothetical protein